MNYERKSIGRQKKWIKQMMGDANISKSFKIRIMKNKLFLIFLTSLFQ
jgi:hypothetical protein